ncbi:Rha family transcriptional regulator [uncultured Campylobacter sp.]|uniref:Rha family transcriptional regulator n=1 Tax=uncultured Campylobacter sp. TaxID=218934 RepID=UPI00262A29D9|nr:Rha family transcriptional regulator [uncultured Campylobacter sp.]
MKNLVVINDRSVEFEVVDNGVFTTSLSVAAVFEKRHDNIIAQIRALPSDNFTALNFKVSEYVDTTGRKLPMYKITRDGFSLLVMGFTGERAYRWKIEFIAAFNKMEAMMRRGDSHLDALIDNMGALHEKIDKLQAKNSALAGELIEANRKYTATLERENELLRSARVSDTPLNAPVLVGTGRKFSPSELQRAQKLKAQGFTNARIAQALGRNLSTVARNLRRARRSEYGLFGGAL